MIVEVFTAGFLPLLVYYLWRYFFGYKRVNVLISCVRDDLRRTVTTRIMDGEASDGHWPVRLIGGTVYNRYFDWDEYCFLELNTYPARLSHTES